MASTSTAVGFRSNRPFLGIASLTIGVSIFSIQDAVIKHLSGQYPVHEIVFVRSLASLLLLLAFVILSEGRRGLGSRRLALHGVRGVALFTSYMAYYLGLASMSIAEAIALFFTVPFFVAALSNLVIGEPVGPRRWAAITVAPFSAAQPRISESDFQRCHTWRHTMSRPTRIRIHSPFIGGSAQW